MKEVEKNKKEKEVAMLKAVNEELFKRNVLYHKIIAQATGSPGLAIMWSQILYWQERTSDSSGWTYKTSEDLYEETGLTRKMQETARKVGKHYKILEEKRAGVPAKMHFRVNMEETIKIVGEYLVNKNGEIEQEDPFDLRDEIVKMEENPRRDMNIIAMYMDMRFDSVKENITNKKTFQTTLRRHLRDAKELVDFSDDQILKGAKTAKAQTKDWTLRTVIKNLTK